MPHPGWTAYASKFIALLGIVFIVLCIAISSGMIAQAARHYTRFQLGLYVKSILVVDFTLFLFLSVLAFLIHVLSSNKYVGYFAYVAFLIANSFAWTPLDVSTRLVRFSSRPGMKELSRLERDEA